jgi:hypothetical protein
MEVRVASIHQIAESYNSRKPPFSLAQPYALGPGRKGVSPTNTTECEQMVNQAAAASSVKK